MIVETKNGVTTFNGVQVHESRIHRVNALMNAFLADLPPAFPNRLTIATEAAALIDNRWVDKLKDLGINADRSPL